MHKLLRNPYYIGVVEYCGRRVAGRHEPLIDQDAFDRVQAVLAARAVAGERASRHHHYLRGTLYCAECGGRMLFGRHKSKTGRHYEYFCCTNRLTRGTGGRCPSRHFPVAAVERKIEDHYRTVRLAASKQNEIRADVRRDGEPRLAVARAEAEKQRRKVEALEANQAHLVQLSYKGLVSDEVLAGEQRRLEAEQKQARKRLVETELEAQEVEAALEEALARTKTPHATYMASTPFERRILNQAFFKRIEVGEGGEIVRVELTPVYEAFAAWHEPLGRPRRPKSRRARRSSGAHPDPVSRGRGSLLNQMVEAGGIEPPTLACKASVFPLAPRPRALSSLAADARAERVRD